MFETKKFISSKVPGEYLEYIEKEEKSSEKLPLVIYIHGAGGLGIETDLLKCFMFPGEIEKRTEYKCRAVMPHCHKQDWAETYTVLLEFIESQINRGDVDSDRVYLMGESLGGYTTWQLAFSRPEWYAAIVPICGGGIHYFAPKLVNINIWAFHGDSDEVVYPEESKRIVDKVNMCGGNAKLTILENTGHDAWTGAMTNDEMWKWMFASVKKKA